jgi:hypothetical protein
MAATEQEVFPGADLPAGLRSLARRTLLAIGRAARSTRATRGGSAGAACSPTTATGWCR